MQQWEYLTIELQGLQQKAMIGTKIIWNANYFSEQLNYYGAQGWELVSCFNTISPLGYGSVTNGNFAMFKRKKES